MSTTSESILEEAQRLTGGDRQSDYGHPLDDFSKVTGMAMALWGRGPQTPREHAIYMCLVKIAREVNKPKRDNRVDLAGYARTIDMIDEEEAKRAASKAQAPKSVSVRDALLDEVETFGDRRRSEFMAGE